METAKTSELEILIQSLGEKVRSIRRERNLTQQELGDLSNLSYKYVGEIERAEKNPSIKVLARISDALGVDLIELLTFDHVPTASGPKGSTGYEANRGRLINRVNRMLKDREISDLETITKILRVLFDKRS